MACSSICRKAGYHVLTRGQWSSLGGNSCLIPGAVDVYRVVVLLCSYARSDYKRSNWQREWLSFSRSFLSFRVGTLSLSPSWIKQIIIFMMISRISVYDVGKSKPKLMFSVRSSRHLKNQRQVRGAQTFSVRKCTTDLLKPLSASWPIQASSLQWGNLKGPSERPSKATVFSKLSEKTNMFARKYIGVLKSPFCCKCSIWSWHQTLNLQRI